MSDIDCTAGLGPTELRGLAYAIACSDSAGWVAAHFLTPFTLAVFLQDLWLALFIPGLFEIIELLFIVYVSKPSEGDPESKFEALVGDWLIQGFWGVAAGLLFASVYCIRPMVFSTPWRSPRPRALTAELRNLCVLVVLSASYLLIQVWSNREAYPWGYLLAVALRAPLIFYAVRFLSQAPAPLVASAAWILLETGFAVVFVPGDRHASGLSNVWHRAWLLQGIAVACLLVGRYSLGSTHQARGV